MISIESILIKKYNEKIINDTNVEMHSLKTLFLTFTALITMTIGQVVVAFVMNIMHYISGQYWSVGSILTDILAIGLSCVLAVYLCQQAMEKVKGGNVLVAVQISNSMFLILFTLSTINGSFDNVFYALAFVGCMYFIHQNKDNLDSL